MHSTLMEVLNADQRRMVENVHAAAGRIWVCPLHHYYTNHTVTHSERVIALLDGLTAGMMTTTKRLSPTEAFVLLAATYLHDIGMQDERYAGGDLEEIRAAHHEVTEELIYRAAEDPTQAFDLGLPDDPGLIAAVALVAKGHRQVDLWSAEYDSLVHGGETIRLRLLAALLRFGDELDIDHRRVDLERMKLLNLPVESQLHWWKCHYVSGVSIVDEDIRIDYRFPRDRADYEKLIVQLVDGEIRAQHAYLEEIFRSQAIKLALGKPQVRLMRLVQPLPPLVEEFLCQQDEMVKEIAPRSPHIESWPTRQMSKPASLGFPEAPWDVALELFRLLPMANPTDQLPLACQQAVEALDRGEWDRALYLTERELDSPVSGDDAHAQTMAVKGVIWHAGGYLDQATKWYQMALDDFRLRRNTVGETIMHITLGRVHESNDEIDKARSIYQEAGVCFQNICGRSIGRDDVRLRRWCREGARVLAACFDRLDTIAEREGLPRRIPRLGTAAAGDPRRFSQQEWEKIKYTATGRLQIGDTTYELQPKVEARRRIKLNPTLDYFITEAYSDSMINAGIHDGDLLLVQVQPQPETGQIVVMGVENEDGPETLVRRIRLDDQWIYLESANPAYEMRIFSRWSPALRILGTVVAVLKPVDNGRRPEGEERDGRR